MKRLFKKDNPVPFIEGIAERVWVNEHKTKSLGTSFYTYFHLRLFDGETPEGVNDPYRWGDKKLDIKEGDHLIVYHGWTEQDRLDTAMGIQKVSDDDEETEELFLRNYDWKGDEELEWQTIN